MLRGGEGSHQTGRSCSDDDRIPALIHFRLSVS